MRFQRRTAIGLGGAVAVAAAATGLAVGGPIGAAVAVIATLGYGLGVIGLELRRLILRQEQRTRRIEESIESMDQAVRNVRSRLIEQGLAAAASGKRIERELEAAGDRAATSASQIIDVLERRLAEDAGTAAAGLESARAQILAGLADLRGDHRDTVRREGRRQYGNVHDLLALYSDIDPGRALPPMRGWAAGADLTRYLYTQVTEQGRTRVLECGSGTTTVVIAYALRRLRTGRVVSLEHDPRFAAATRRMLAERGLDDWAEVIDAPLVDLELSGGSWRWYDPKTLPEGEFDLLLVDGPPGATGPQARYPALPMLLDRFAEDAVLVLDDAFRPEERATAERWLTEFEGFTSERLRHERGTIVLRRDR